MNIWQHLKEALVMVVMLAVVVAIIDSGRVVPATEGPTIDRSQEREISPTLFEKLRVKPVFQRLPSPVNPAPTGITPATKPAPMPTAPSEMSNRRVLRA